MGGRVGHTKESRQERAGDEEGLGSTGSLASIQTSQEIRPSLVPETEDLALSVGESRPG